MKAVIIVGRFHSKKTRDFLNKCQEEGMAIEFTEKGSVFDKKFIISGSQMDLNIVTSRIKLIWVGVIDRSYWRIAAKEHE